MKVIRLEQLKFKYKMVFSFGVVIFLMVLVAVSSLAELRSISNKILYYTHQVQAADTAVKMCRIQTNSGARNLREMALTDDTEEQKNYQEAASAAIATLDGYLETLKNSGVVEEALYQKYEKAVRQWVEIGTNIEQQLLDGKKEEAVQMILKQCSPALQEVIDAGQEIDAVTTELKDDTLKTNERTILNSAVTTCILLVLAIILAIAVAGRIVKGVLLPLRELEQASSEMAQGNFDTEITYQSQDEMGNLAVNMRHTMKALSGIIKDITYLMNEMAEQNFDIHTQEEEHYTGQFLPVLKAIRKMNQIMNETMNQIAVSAEQVSSGSEQIAVGSQELAQGAVSQSASVEELMKTMASISEHIKRTAANAEDTNELTERTGEEVVFCHQKMTEMMEAIKSISVQSEKINEIVKSIEDIAFQTNILSLNAAIEAARAGEAGKSFAIVAEQVRDLAARSAKASQSAFRLITETIEAVENGSRIANETEGSLSKILESSQPIVEKVGGIAEAASRETEAAELIAQGILQISTVVQTNSATAEESAAASEELSAQAQALEMLVAQFTLVKKES